jgi:hypothetical protein
VLKRFASDHAVYFQHSIFVLHQIMLCISSTRSLFGVRGDKIECSIQRKKARLSPGLSMSCQVSLV